MLIHHVVRTPSFLLKIGVKGLPDEWRLALESSSLSKDEIMNNSDAVINVLTYQFSQPPEPTVGDMLDVNALLSNSIVYCIISVNRIIYSS